VTLTITATIVAGPSWIGTSSADLSGDWRTAADWSGHAVPSPEGTATIAAAGTSTVTSGTGNTIGSLDIADPSAELQVTAGAFTIDGASSNAGLIRVVAGADLGLAGGSIAGGTGHIQSGATLAATGGGGAPSAITGASLSVWSRPAARS
jgi:hypothetical protein